jgi:hypothetical protein
MGAPIPKQRIALSGTGSDVVTPELALVDPELAEAQRQIPDRKAAMSTTPSNGTFFTDPAQPAAQPVSPDLSAVPVPLAEPVAAAAEPVSLVPAPQPPHVPAAATLAPDDGSTPMRDVPLGTLIFRAGLLAEEQLEDALQDGMRTGKRLGEVLLERGWLHERDLGRLLAGQKGLPFVEVRASDAEGPALQMLPEEKARLQITLPLRYEEGQLVVAVADPSNELVLENLRRTIGSEPRLVVAPQSELIRAIGEAYASVVPQEPTRAPEPTPQLEAPPQLEPPLAQEPTPQPEPTVAQEPTLMQEPTLSPEPTLPQEQPVPAPLVTPLPTVLPPAETRAPQPVEAPLLQPLVIEPAAEVVEQPAAVEQMAPSAPTVEETPLVVEQPAPQPEPTVVPEAVTPPAPPPVEAQPAPLEPLTPVAPLQPPAETVETQPAPEAPVPLLIPPAAEQPLESAPVPFGQIAAPMPPEVPVEAPAVSEQTQPDPSSIHVVLLRLNDGETLEVGTFSTAAKASARAEDIVRQISTAEGQATWPFFAERYLRPDTIVSVDLLEESADKWLGSAARTRWANQ